MLKFNDILNGWENYFVPDPVIEEEAKRRAEICLDCPFIKHGKVLAFLKDRNMKEITGAYCDDCGCPLVSSTRSKKYKCPKNKW